MPPKPDVTKVQMFQDGTNYTCYFDIGPDKNYSTTISDCAVWGSQLAVIDTAEKMLHLKNHSLCNSGLAYIHSL